MRAHIVENGVVTNVIEVEEGVDLSIFNAVDLGDYAAIGDTVVNGASPEAAQRESDAIVANVRAKRDELLASTDWWAVSDRTMTQEQIDYRQALRDLPSQEGFPNVEFPTKP